VVIKWHACTIAPRCTRQEMWQLVVIKWSSVIIKWSSVIAYCRGQPWRCDLDAQRHCDGGGDANGGLDGQRPAAVQHNAKSQHKTAQSSTNRTTSTRASILSFVSGPSRPDTHPQAPRPHSIWTDGSTPAKTKARTLIQGAFSLARCRSARRGVGCTVVTEYGKATTQVNTPHVPSKYLQSTMRSILSGRTSKDLGCDALHT
jgi:hypothetical protein